MAPDYPDPDRPMTVSAPKPFNHDFGPTVAPPVAVGLTRAIQAIASLHDSRNGDYDWRIDAYRQIFDDLSNHNQIGTGTEGEKALHEALAVIAKALNVRNA